VLAAVSLASAVFIGTVNKRGPEFENSIGLFVLSFIVLISAAMQYASTSSGRPELDAKFRIYSYVLASFSFYLGIALSSLGLRLLVLDIDLANLAEVLKWVLLASIVLGSLRVCVQLYRHTRIVFAHCLLILFLGFGVAFVYRGLGELWADLWPSHNASLWLSVVVFAVAGISYVSQTVLLAFHGAGKNDALADMAPRWLVAYGQVVISVIVLVWIAVAEA